MPAKKILLISQVFYPDEVAVSNLFTRLCVILTEKGDPHIEVWSAQPSYTCLERQPRYRKYMGIDIFYLPSTNFHKDKKFGRLMNILTFSFSVLVKMLFSSGRQTVIAHTVPPLLAIFIAFVCRLKRNRLIYVLMDVFPDGLIRLNRLSEKNILVALWQKLHLQTFKISSRIVVIGRDMEEWLLSVYPDGKDKISYIPLWQDDDLIKPVPFDENTFIIKYKLHDRFIVQYSGNMGLWNDMKTMGTAVNMKPENVFFVFIGGGMRKKELVDQLGEKSPDNALLIPFLPNYEFAYSVSACHVALVSFRKDLEGMAVPSKIIGIMAAGVPVIAIVPVKSEIARIIIEENCGYVISPGDAAGIIDAINKLKDDEGLRRQMGENGRKAFEKKYTTRIVAEKYKRLISDLPE
jgi:glycosyltransferase involved in cell wall biosynthesis